MRYAGEGIPEVLERLRFLHLLPVKYPETFHGRQGTPLDSLSVPNSN